MPHIAQEENSVFKILTPKANRGIFSLKVLAEPIFNYQIRFFGAK
jgi:hypothetical protein